jgi:hypothetical protein
MNIRRLLRISLPVLVVALLIGVMALDAPTAQAIARYDGPGHWTNPPGWSHNNGVARFDGPGHWTNPPGWSHNNGIARYDGPGHWTNPPGWSHNNGVARYDGPGHWINPPGWSQHNGLAFNGFDWGDKPGNGSPWHFPHAPGWPGV